jgi:hypothetical protein
LGPINQTLFVVMLIQRPNVGVDYEYSLPTNIQPGYETESYVWTFDQFSLCSQTCGGGCVATKSKQFLRFFLQECNTGT